MRLNINQSFRLYDEKIESQRGLSLKNAHHSRNHSQLFKEFMKSFILDEWNPELNHYHRHLAPNRRYIYGTTIVNLHKQFTEQLVSRGIDERCDVSYIYKYLQNENIAVLPYKTYDCPTCIAHHGHHLERGEIITLHESCSTHDDCPLCEDFRLHKKWFKAVRAEMRGYTKQNLILKGEWPETKVFTSDTQNIIKLPKFADKSLFNYTKIGILNQKFAEIGSKSQSICVLANMAEVNRGGREIFNMFIKFLNHPYMQDTKKLIIFSDNCSSQYKNYVFISNLVAYINQEKCKLTSITMQFLEKGHTFMSADAVHSLITKKYNDRREIYTNFLSYTT